jgi:hypothetical protein
VGAARLGGDAGEGQQRAVGLSGCDDERQSHNSRRKAREGGAGGAMRGRTGEARQPEARAGRSEPHWLQGAGGWGMTR